MMHTGREYAFIGDAVWGLKIKLRLVESNINLGKDIYIATAYYLSASAQASLFQRLYKDHFFSEIEQTIYKKGRNIKVTKRNSHENITIYRCASGFEAIIGYLYMENQCERIDEIIDIMMQENKNESESI